MENLPLLPRRVKPAGAPFRKTIVEVQARPTPLPRMMKSTSNARTGAAKPSPSRNCQIIWSCIKMRVRPSTRPNRTILMVRYFYTAARLRFQAYRINSQLIYPMLSITIRPRLPPTFRLSAARATESTENTKEAVTGRTFSWAPLQSHHPPPLPHRRPNPEQRRQRQSMRRSEG